MRGWIAYVQTHLPFGINEWPSWANEALGGILLGLPALALVAARHPILAAVAVVAAHTLSEVYEQEFDARGYLAQDVLERARGLLLVVAIALIVGGNG